MNDNNLPSDPFLTRHEELNRSVRGQVLVDAIAAEMKLGQAAYTLMATFTEDDLRDIAFAKLLDVWAPGWQATVFGGKLPPLAADRRMVR